MDIRKRLFELQDLGYQTFSESLIPGEEVSKIIGVRTPAIRELAKRLIRNPELVKEKDDFIKPSNLPHEYHEENLLHFFLIAQIKDYAQCVEAVDAFLPYVNNWAVCDQPSPKVFKKHHDLLIDDIRRWISSEHVYTARFGIRMLMNEFLDEEFRPEYLDLVGQKEGEAYYLQMMQAWYFATALAKQYDATVPYIELGKLHPWVHRKTIQKAVESYRVSDEHKEYLKSFRR